MKPAMYLAVATFIQTVPFTNSSYLTWQNDNCVMFNKPEKIVIQVGSTVDVLKSTFIVNDVKIKNIDDQFIFELAENGKTRLVYELKDQEGNLLKQGEEIFTLDMNAPMVSANIDGVDIIDKIGVIDSLNLNVHVEESNLKVSKVFIDNNFVMESNENNFNIPIRRDQSSIHIITYDTCGNKTETKYEIENINPLKIKSDIPENGYTLNSTHYFSCEGENSNDWSLLIESNGGMDHRDFIEENQLQVVFQKNNIYNLKCIHKKYRYLFSSIDDTLNRIIVTEQPTPKIYVNNIKRDDSGNLSMDLKYDNNRIQTGFVEIVSNGLLVKSNLQERIYLNEKDNSISKYKIHIYAIDNFGRKVETTEVFEWNNTLPKYNVTVNGKEYHFDRPIIYSSLPDIEIKFDREVNVKIYDAKTQLYLGNNIHQILFNSQYRQNLEILLNACDQFGNTVNIPLSFRYKPKYVSQKQEMDWGTAKKHVVKKEIFSPNKKDKLQFKRVWNLNENHQIRLEKNEVVIKDNTKPKIKILKNLEKIEKKYNKNDRIRILLESALENDTFECIKINNHSIPLKQLKKDEFGRKYYEFVAKEKEYFLEIRAVDQANHVTDFKKYLKMEPRVDAIHKLLPICIVLFSLFLIKRLHGLHNRI